jgi:mono/diheme cytochrome c family protein
MFPAAFGRAAAVLLVVGSAFLLTSGLTSVDAAEELPPVADKEIDFAEDIRPIFQTFCIKCHGAEKQLSGFRLDREGDALRGGDAGVPFEVGKSAESLLIKYVAGLDPDVTMPPEGKKLSEEQVGLLRAWIDQGARWAEEKGSGEGETNRHWSFQPIRRPKEPEVRQPDRVRTPIDRFVLARLDAEKLVPASEADRPTLIRRLSLDLLGLPPTPAEMEAFVNDQSADAYEQLVDRLIASPHFGERWARHWLDLARYADSDGYEKDRPRPHAWRYRHWLIEAINRDLPFDQFTIEQIAGDLLPEATLDQKIATGFHRNTLTNTEGGVDQEEYRVAAVVDRVNTTSGVWLGLTMGCAQCHTHKYDPLTLREYYGMFAFFNQGQEVDIPAPLPHEARAYTEAKAVYDNAHTPFLAAIAAFEKNELPARQAEWERSLDRSSLVGWRVLEPETVVSAGNVKLTRQPDGSYLASGTNPAEDTITITLKSDLAGITAFRLEVLPDKSLPAQGPGRVAHGNFVLSEFRVTSEFGGAEPVPVIFGRTATDFAQDGWPVAAAIDGNTKTGWAIAPQYGRTHAALFETASSIASAGTKLTFTLDQQYGSQHTIGRFRLLATTAARPVRLDGLPDDLLPILALAVTDRTAEQRSKLSAYYVSIDAEMIRLRKAETDHAATAPSPPGTLALTLADVPQPRKTHIHLRGDFLRKGDEVPPHVPAVLPSLKNPADRVPGRLELARWLVSRENPLAPRVTMNRVWKHLFGQALVASMDDFGTRGEQPSHPELLDWLASEFMEPTIATSSLTKEELPWSVKRMIRLIVTSATYRQSSQPRTDLSERDPKNILLARQNRFRVEAEILRDLYLAASGLLNPAIGGPSVRPKQPAGISELTYAGAAKWIESTGADRYRRGLYTWFQRTSPYPMLMTFDAPESNVTCTRRERSNTPLQALTLLNDPVFHECAQRLGRRMMKDRPADPAARLQYGFELCLARPPTPQELSRLLELYDEFHEAAAIDPSTAAQLAGDPRPNEADLASVAAAIAVARIILNLDEFMTRE